MSKSRPGTRRGMLTPLSILVAFHAVWAFAADDFTIVLLPDTQFYSQSEPTTYLKQTQWIRDNVETDNIKFVVHLGDLVNVPTNTTQWQNASAAQAVLDDNAIPNSVLPGNHDMVGSGSPNYTRDTTNYDAYFPRSRYSSQPWFGGTYGSNNQNNYNYFTAGGMDFMVLSLEMMPRPEVVNWANAVLQAHPNHRVILATHFHLNPDAERHTTNVGWNYSGLNGQQVYDQVVYNNPNIFLVASGHICYEALVPSRNAAGGQVYELLSDYQRTFSDTDERYGAGWLRTLRFSPDDNRITVGSYSPKKDEYDRFDSFAIEYDMGGMPTPPPERPLADLRARWEFETGGADSIGTRDLNTVGTPIDEGRFGNGLHLGGYPSHFAYRSTIDDSVLTVSEAFSAAAWIKYDSNNDRLARVFTLMPNAENGCNLGFLDGDAASSAIVVRIMKDDVAYHVVTDETIDRDAFHHVAFSFDDLAGPTACKKIKLWIDGEEVAVSEANHYDGVRGYSNNFVISRVDTPLIDVLDPFDFPDAHFSGVLDELRWYEGVLSDRQIAALQYVSLPGDANDDGRVDDEDAKTLAAHWGQSGVWTQGDFNNDGAVNALDASILAANWGQDVTTEQANYSTAVPEPSGLSMLIALVFLNGGRRRRAIARSIR